MYSPEKNMIFIHIPKTGGHSVKSVIKFNHQFHFHENINTIKKDLDRDIFNNAFKFTIVRNPFNRIKSLFKHNIYAWKKFPPNYSFTNFILKLNTIHWSCSQLYQITKDSDHLAGPDYTYLPINNIGDILVDKIYKFENLKELEDDLYIKLPYKNINYNKIDIVYTNKTRNIIYKMYKKEFEIFGYQ